MLFLDVLDQSAVVRLDLKLAGRRGEHGPQLLPLVWLERLGGFILWALPSIRSAETTQVVLWNIQEVVAISALLPVNGSILERVLLLEGVAPTQSFVVGLFAVVSNHEIFDHVEDLSLILSATTTASASRHCLHSFSRHACQVFLWKAKALLPHAIVNSKISCCWVCDILFRDQLEFRLLYRWPCTCWQCLWCYLDRMRRLGSVRWLGQQALLQLIESQHLWQHRKYIFVREVYFSKDHVLSGKHWRLFLGFHWLICFETWPA